MLRVLELLSVPVLMNLVRMTLYFSFRFLFLVDGDVDVDVVLALCFVLACHALFAEILWYLNDVSDLAEMSLENNTIYFAHNVCAEQD